MTPLHLRRPALAAAAFVLSFLSLSASRASTPAVERAEFGRLPDGRMVDVFTLSNGRGAVARVLTLGAIVADLRIPLSAERTVGVVREILPSESGFQRGFPQSAAVFGRVANRIAQARFTLDGREYRVTANNGRNQLHGGRQNFSRVLWQARPAGQGTPAVTLTYRSVDGEEGFPGNLDVTVTYTLAPDHTLRIEYSAQTDRPTPINLTNHAYFNLAGRGDVTAHELTLAAARYTVVDAELIPTGEIRPVEGSPLDFRRPTPLGARAAALAPAVRYDNNFVLDRPSGGGLAFAARVRAPESGLTMETWTTEPGVQLYTSPLGSDGASDRFGFYCLETQHFPDSVNHPHFPSTILRPGDTFRSTTEFRFRVVP